MFEYVWLGGISNQRLRKPICAGKGDLIGAMMETSKMCTADCQPCVIGNNFEFWKLMKNLKAVSGSLTDVYDQYLWSTLINQCLLVELLHKI